MLTRVLQTRKATLAHTFRVGEAPTDAAGDVSVEVKRLDGTAVTDGTADAGDLDDGTYTFDLVGTHTQLLDTYTIDWSGTVDGAEVTERDIVEVVGGFLFDLTRARNDLKLSASTYPTATLEEKRTVVEVEAEGIAERAFVPRFARVLIDGSGASELVVPDMDLREVRSAKVAARAGGTFTALTAEQLAATAALPEGILVRDDGGRWPAGRRNVLVEYEHGLDMPPADVHDVAILRLRSVLATTKTQIPDRAVSFTVSEGGVYRLAAATASSTGFPDVDAAYKRHGHQRVWIAS